MFGIPSEYNVVLFTTFVKLHFSEVKRYVYGKCGHKNLGYLRIFGVLRDFFFFFNFRIFRVSEMSLKNLLCSETSRFIL